MNPHSLSTITSTLFYLHAHSDTLIQQGCIPAPIAPLGHPCLRCDFRVASQALSLQPLQPPCDAPASQWKNVCLIRMQNPCIQFFLSGLLERSLFIYYYIQSLCLFSLLSSLFCALVDHNLPSQHQHSFHSSSRNISD